MDYNIGQQPIGLPIHSVAIITNNVDVDNRLRLQLNSCAFITFPTQAAADHYFDSYMKEVDYLYIDVDSVPDPKNISSYMVSVIMRKLDTKIFLVAARLETLKRTEVDSVHYWPLPADRHKS